MKKFGVCLLAMLMLVGAFGCAQEQNPSGESATDSSVSTTEIRSETEAETESETESETDSETESETEADGTVVLENEDKIYVRQTDYDIHHFSQSISALRSSSEEHTGVSLGVRRVRDGTDITTQAKFLVGALHYEETQSVLAALPPNSYTVTVTGNRVVVVGTDDNLTVMAMREFRDRFLTSDDYVKDGKLVLTEEESFTVTLEHPLALADLLQSGLTVYALYERRIASPAQGEYVTGQGVATDGTYVYFILRNENDTGAIITKYSLEDEELVATSEPLSLGHGNDMTYNSEENLLVVAHGKEEGKILTLVDPETLTPIKNVDIEKSAGAIAYDPSTGGYAISSGGKKIHLLDAEFNYVQTFDREKLSGYTAQGMGLDATYYFFPMSKAGDNVLDVFDREGNRLPSIHIYWGNESESMFEVDGRYYVACNEYGNTLYEVYFRVTM